MWGQNRDPVRPGPGLSGLSCLVLFAGLGLAACAVRSPEPSFPPPAMPGSGGGADGAGSATGVERMRPPVAAVPARLLPGMGEACLARIEAFAAERTGNRVILGSGAFATGSELVLTRLPRRGPDGRLLDGRAADPDPVVLHLRLGAAGCIVRAASGPAEALLPDCRCEAVGP